MLKYNIIISLVLSFNILLPFVSEIMEKGTRKAPSAVVNIRTRFCPIVQWMEFVFLPSMAFYASKMVLTPFIIIDNNLILSFQFGQESGS